LTVAVCVDRSSTDTSVSVPISAPSSRSLIADTRKDGSTAAML